MFWSLDRTRLTFCFAALAKMTSVKCPKIRQLTTKHLSWTKGKLGHKPPDVRKKKKKDHQCIHINLIGKQICNPVGHRVSAHPGCLREFHKRAH